MKKILEILLFCAFVGSIFIVGFHLCKNAHHHCKQETNNYKDYRSCLGI